MPLHPFDVGRDGVIRNGGDLESLRQLLGHTSYTMVKRYAELAADVVAETHEKA